MLLMDKGIARLEGGDLAFIVVDANDGMTDLCKADSRDQANISRANDRDLNGFAHVVRRMDFLQNYVMLPVYWTEHQSRCVARMCCRFVTRRCEPEPGAEAGITSLK